LVGTKPTESEQKPAHATVGNIPIGFRAFISAVDGLDDRSRNQNIVEIRRYQAGEENAIWNIVFLATRESIARDYHPDLIERWAPHDKDMGEWTKRLAQQNPFIAIVDGVPVGMGELEDSGFIDYFYVHPKFQGVGVGKALLAVIENEAERLGIGRIYADVSVTAEPFFSARGFEVVEARSNTILGHSAPNFAMAKHINSEQSAPFEGDNAEI
jgi:putative acetyltransferase